MKEKVVEILMYIMSEMQESKSISDIDMSDLKSRGYTQSEISAAFSWLHDNFQMRSGSRTSPDPGSRRVLHDVEKSAISTEAQGYLIHLRELGLLSDQDLENVIERAMTTGFERLTVSELRTIVASVLFAKSPSSGTNRLMLNTEDTVH